MLVHKIRGRLHCCLGYIAAELAAISLLSGLWILSGQVIPGGEMPKELIVLQESVSSVLPENESMEYQGIMLMPISSQGNNAIEGTQYIDKESYRLEISGLVNGSQNLSYEELLALPAYSEVAYMPCVEGWGFYAKWTGFRVSDLLNRSGLQPDADNVVFHTADGYSTGLPLDYLRDNTILMAYGINDVTLLPERGFPFQLVAKGRYGYKWAKWITRIEVTDKEVRGYWESRGYSNSARVGEVPFG
jgi:DMSO/TMAO reductase YedYZ molybdopterin-dependent catalytic subunit